MFLLCFLWNNGSSLPLWLNPVPWRNVHSWSPQHQSLLWWSCKLCTCSPSYVPSNIPYTQAPPCGADGSGLPLYHHCCGHGGCCGREIWGAFSGNRYIPDQKCIFFCAHVIRCTVVKKLCKCLKPGGNVLFMLQNLLKKLSFDRQGNSSKGDCTAKRYKHHRRAHSWRGGSF